MNSLVGRAVLDKNRRGPTAGLSMSRLCSEGFGGHKGVCRYLSGEKLPRQSGVKRITSGYAVTRDLTAFPDRVHLFKSNRWRPRRRTGRVLDADQICQLRACRAGREPGAVEAPLATNSENLCA